jgi:hypothetical protein
MDRLTREALMDEYELHSRVVIAAEDWSHQYDKDPDSHADLIKAEAKLERQLKQHFRDCADKAASFVNWKEYYAVKAYNIQVIVLDDAVGNTDSTVFELIFDTVASATAAGAQAGETIYGIQLGLDSYSATIQKVAREQVAQLVGKKVMSDGQVVDNINSAYRISKKMLDDIRQSVHTSITLGENYDDALKRMKKVINNPKRAATIARTESVNAYGRGLMSFGQQSKAVGKEWQAVGAVDQCAVYEGLGAVPFDYIYDPVLKITAPTAHPNCRCGLRLIYQNELDANPNLFGDNAG